MISYGSRHRYTLMPQNRRSHQLGEGQSSRAFMPQGSRPPQLVLESQGSDAEMPMRDRSQGKGQTMTAEMPEMEHPSQSVYGSRNHNAAMPMEKRSHLFTRGHTNGAEMPLMIRLSREGSSWPRRNVIHGSPFPNSFIWCRDHLAEMPLLKRTKGRVNPTLQQCQNRHALPHQFWATPKAPQGQRPLAQF